MNAVTDRHAPLHGTYKARDKALNAERLSRWEQDTDGDGVMLGRLLSGVIVTSALVLISFLV